MVNRLVMLSCLMSAVAAMAAPRWGLKVKAVTGCIEAPELARAVEAKLERSVFATDADLKIDGIIDGVPGAWKARLTLVSRDGEILGNREVPSGEASCRSLDGKLTAVIALLIEAGAPPAVEPPKPAATAPLPAAPTPEDPRGVFVHIDADKTGAQLIRVAGQGTGIGSNGQAVTVTNYETVCSAPCDWVVTNPGSKFFIAGDVAPSTTFLIESFRSGVNIKVSAGSKALFYMGVVMNLVGGVTGTLSGLGLVIFAVAQMLESPLVLPLAIVAGVSAVMLGVGIPLTIVTRSAFQLNAYRRPTSGPTSPALSALPTVSAAPMTLARF